MIGWLCAFNAFVYRSEGLDEGGCEREGKSMNVKGTVGERERERV